MSGPFPLLRGCDYYGGMRVLYCDRNPFIERGPAHARSRGAHAASDSPRSILQTIVLMHAIIRTRLRFILPVLFLLAVPAFAQPKIHVVGGDTVDLGHVTPGILQHDLTIVNVGTDTLQLLGFSSGMMSVTGDISTTELGSGDSLKLVVKIDATRKTGERKGWVKIQSNDPERSMLTIPVRAFAVRHMYVEPDGAILFKDVTVGKESRQEITIRNISTRNITVSPEIEYSGGTAVMRVDIPKPKVIPAGGTITLDVYLTPLEAGTGEAFIDFRAVEEDIPVSKVQVFFNATK